MRGGRAQESWWRDGITYGRLSYAEAARASGAAWHRFRAAPDQHAVCRYPGPRRRGALLVSDRSFIRTSSRVSPSARDPGAIAVRIASRSLVPTDALAIRAEAPTRWASSRTATSGCAVT